MITVFIIIAYGVTKIYPSTMTADLTADWIHEVL